jgi:hypothetical protein
MKYKITTLSVSAAVLGLLFVNINEILCSQLSKESSSLMQQDRHYNSAVAGTYKEREIDKNSIYVHVDGISRGKCSIFDNGPLKINEDFASIFTPNCLALLPKKQLLKFLDEENARFIPPWVFRFGHFLDIFDREYPGCLYHLNREQLKTLSNHAHSVFSFFTTEEAEDDPRFVELQEYFLKRSSLFKLNRLKFDFTEEKLQGVLTVHRGEYFPFKMMGMAFLDFLLKITMTGHTKDLNFFVQHPL